VCEPLSYSQSMNGFSLTGSVIDSHYQGGNFWAAYGNWANPFGNIPFTARAPDLVSLGKIGTAVPSFRGDYAPLISSKVYKVAFAEHGLPASTKSTAFLVRILNAMGEKVLWRNFTATTPTGPHGQVELTFYVPDGTYQFQVGTATIASTPYYPHPSTGSFTVSGHHVPTRDILFTMHDAGTVKLSGSAREETGTILQTRSARVAAGSESQ
jgi:hypothetical protein